MFIVLVMLWGKHKKPYGRLNKKVAFKRNILRLERCSDIKRLDTPADDEQGSKLPS